MLDAARKRARSRGGRYDLLLGAIIVAFAIQGIAEPGRVEEVVVSALLGATLLLALRVANTRPRIVRPAVLIVAALVLASIVDAASGNVGDGLTRVANALLVALAPPAIVVGVLRSLREKQAVTLEAVFGVLCVYLLIGMFFASMYGTIDRLGGNPFFAGGAPATVARCQYFSFASLTTVGFGDLTARSNLGHTLSVFEALLGQIYLVTVVALIVANLGRGRPVAKGQ